MKFGNVQKRVFVEIERLYPKVTRKDIYWRLLKELQNYIIVKVTVRVLSGYNHPKLLALHTSDKILHLDNIASLSELLGEENLEIREQNVAEIMEIVKVFESEQAILTSIQDIIEPISFFFLRENKINKIQRYANVIQPPVLESKNVPTITFWTINLLINDLEQWEISGHIDEKPKIEYKTLETNIVRTVPRR